MFSYVYVAIVCNGLAFVALLFYLWDSTTHLQKVKTVLTFQSRIPFANAGRSKAKVDKRDGSHRHKPRPMTGMGLSKACNADGFFAIR